MDMVEVALGDKDGVHAGERISCGIGWVAIDPGIENDNLAGFEVGFECAVAWPGDVYQGGCSFVSAWHKPVRLFDSKSRMQDVACPVPCGVTFG